MTEILQGLTWGALAVFSGLFAYTLIQIAKSIVAFRRWKKQGRR